MVCGWWWWWWRWSVKCGVLCWVVEGGRGRLLCWRTVLYYHTQTQHAYDAQHTQTHTYTLYLLYPTLPTTSSLSLPPSLFPTAAPPLAFPLAMTRQPQPQHAAPVAAAVVVVVVACEAEGPSPAPLPLPLRRRLRRRMRQMPHRTSPSLPRAPAPRSPPAALWQWHSTHRCTATRHQVAVLAVLAVLVELVVVVVVVVVVVWSCSTTRLPGTSAATAALAVLMVTGT